HRRQGLSTLQNALPQETGVHAVPRVPRPSSVAVAGRRRLVTIRDSLQGPDGGAFMQAVERLRELVDVAAGRAPAGTVLANARIVNVHTGDLEEGNVALHGGRIAGVGDYTAARRTIDLRGRYLAPGFIDPHIHLESSLLWVTEFARTVVPHGTSVTVSDP